MDIYEVLYFYHPQIDASRWTYMSADEALRQYLEYSKTSDDDIQKCIRDLANGYVDHRVVVLLKNGQVQEYTDENARFVIMNSIISKEPEKYRAGYEKFKKLNSALDFLDHDIINKFYAGIFENNA